MKRWTMFQKALQQARTNRKEEEMKGYKGFRKGLICKGKQYAENTVFEEEEAVICENGMHFCKNPFDVLDYYGFVDENGHMNEFSEVEALAETDTNDNKKYCTTKLSFAGFVKTCVDFVLEKTTVEIGDADENKIGSSGNSAQIGSSGNSAQIGSSGNSAQIGSSGNSAKIGSSGNSAQIGSSGNSAQIGSSGNSAKIGSSGNSAQIGSSGNSAQIGSSGNSAQIGSSGNSAQIGSSGNSAKIGSSGNSAQIGSSGNSAQIGSSGNSAQIGSSGNYAKIGSSGYYAQIGSSGYSAKIGSSGNYAKIGSTGEDSVICCAGHNSIVKAKKGSWITLSEWEYSEEKKRVIPLCVKTEYVDGERIKADTFYRLVKGEFKEVN